MKRIFQTVLGVAVISTMLATQSCDKLKGIVKTPDVSFSGASTDIVIPATNDTTAQGSLATVAFTYNIDSMIKSQTGGVVGFSAISTVKIQSITLTLLDATPTNNFANFTYAAGAFNTDANNGSLPEYTFGYITNNPDSYQDVLSPPVTDSTQDIKKYFSSNTVFTYLVLGKLRRPLTAALHCHIDVTYNISF